jgi:hypothetical protein
MSPRMTIKTNERTNSRILVGGRKRSVKLRLMPPAKKPKSPEKLWSGLASAAGIISVSIAVISLTTLISEKATRKANVITEDNYSALRMQILDNERIASERLGEAKKAFDAIKDEAMNTEDGRAAFAALELKIAGLEAKIDSLENALSLDPVRAVSVPILRRDLDSYKDQNQKDMQSIEKQVDRIYDQGKWLLGLIIPLGLTLLTVSLTVFFQSKKTDKSAS